MSDTTGREEFKRRLEALLNEKGFGLELSAVKETFNSTAWIVGAIVFSLWLSLLIAEACRPSPVSTPQPPTTTTTTTLAPDPCPWTVPRTEYIYCKDFTPWLTGRRWDCTPQRAVAVHGGMPVWPEDANRAACELKSTGGPPLIWIDGAPESLLFGNLTNPWQFYLAGIGTGTLHCTVPARHDQELCGYEVTHE